MRLLGVNTAMADETLFEELSQQVLRLDLRRNVSHAEVQPAIAVDGLLESLGNDLVLVKLTITNGLV